MHFPHNPAIWLKDLLINAGLSFKMASFLSTVGLVMIILLLSWLLNVIAKVIITLRVIRR